MKDKFYTISDLKNRIHRKLIPYINNDYHLLDTPNYPNVGDQLIWQGQIDFLKNINYSCLSSTDDVFFSFPKLDSSEIILLQGGGNFGDKYTNHQYFRELVIKKYKNNKIIMFPQSVHFEDEKNFQKTVEIFKSHDNLILCARDEYSHNLFQTHLSNCENLLLPDMAFCSELKLNNNISPSEKFLFLKRNDSELRKEDHISFDLKKFDVLDWPTHNKSFFRKKHILWMIANRKISNLIYSNSLFKNFDKNWGLIPPMKREAYIQLGINFLSPYRANISTRLHGHIYSILLGIPSVFLDNSYGKNSRFYDVWLKDIPHSYFAENHEEAYEIIKNLS